ncbi:hypothetical protein FZC69_03115 [Bacillus altitudinis]|nr:hypothetical protein FZC69_03115 [Bacillus altitudinis]
MSVLRADAHECQIRSAPVLVLPRLQRFSITLKRRQRAKIKFILALCQQSEPAFKQAQREEKVRVFKTRCPQNPHFCLLNCPRNDIWYFSFGVYSIYGVFKASKKLSRFSRQPEPAFKQAIFYFCKKIKFKENLYCFSFVSDIH